MARFGRGFLPWKRRIVSLARSLTAGAPVVTFSAPAAARVATITLVATAPVVTFTAPFATAGTILTAGAPVVTFTAPAAARTATITRTAGAPVVTFTAPTAASFQPLAAGAPVVTFSAPAPTLVLAGTLAAGAPLVTFTAPTATLTLSGAHPWASILDINTRWRAYLENLYGYSTSSSKDLTTMVERRLGELATGTDDVDTLLAQLDAASKV